MSNPEVEFKKLVNAVGKLNELLKIKYICKGAKISSLFFATAIALVLVTMQLFLITYLTIGVVVISYLVLDKCMDRIDSKIQDNLKLLSHRESYLFTSKTSAKEQ